ncbi:hypothetical protein LTR09_009104 [Extremus antarcticus]|uniref:Putative phospholipase n=1 Tax=Extremus antarcticus TaxID=702011 RepID=A0AAJ0D9U2_9PEZI|nr:hypothetical protein LTR09_009104 [Extremus antarcticus]
MASALLSSLNPVNAFPKYHGSYSVGTVDVEVPISDLPSPSEVPEDAQPTIAFRIFYPCVKPASSDQDRPVRWVPQPQRLTIAALMKFLGIKERTAGLMSYLPQQFYYIKLRAHRNAKLLDPPTSNGRWPVTVFSHGLAGSRNAYSYVCGDMASNGMIVIALDHRDGSSPIQYVRGTAGTEAKCVYPVKISHEPCAEVYEARDKQLRIRLWEISMAYEALMKIDKGQELENLDSNTSLNPKERVEMLWQFDGKMDIQRAGKVTWCGHSFGAVTMTQLVKTIYYASERTADDGKPLLTPNADAAIVHQILPESPTLLLDMWGLPLQSPDQAFLWNRPLPSYAVGGPQGANILSILSEGFYNWKDNLNVNKHTIAAPSRSRRPSAAPRLTREKGKLLPAWARLRDHSPGHDSGYASHDSRSPARSLHRQRSRASGLSSALSSATPSPKTSPDRQPQKSEGPHMFYVERSQHFNQSDFGILFPWIARRFTKAEEPERILELNVRAMVQVLRGAGIEVAGADDPEILSTEKVVRSWMSVPVDDENAAQATEPGALSAVNRKLSVPSIKGNAAPKDSMTMGQQKVGDEIEM